MGNDGARRVRDYADAQRSRGLVRVAVWVPKARARALKAAAARMRKEAGLRMRSEGPDGESAPHGRPILGEPE